MRRRWMFRPDLALQLDCETAPASVFRRRRGSRRPIDRESPEAFSTRGKCADPESAQDVRAAGKRGIWQCLRLKNRARHNGSTLPAQPALRKLMRSVGLFVCRVVLSLLVNYRGHFLNIFAGTRAEIHQYILFNAVDAIVFGRV